MNVSITNIGKISDASFSVNDITVIAGINSSGKTTVAKVLAGILNPLSNLSSYVNDLRLQSINSKVLDWLSGFSNTLFFEAYFNHLKPADTLYEFLRNNNRSQINGSDLYDLFISGKRAKKPAKEKTDSLAEQLNNILFRQDSDYYERIFELSLSSFFGNQIVTEGVEQGFVSLDNTFRFQIAEKKSKITVLSQDAVFDGQVVYISAGFSFSDWPFSDHDLRMKERSRIMNYENNGFYTITDQLRKPSIHSNSTMSFEDYEETKERISLFKDLIEGIVNGFVDINSEKGTTFVENGSNSINLCNVATGVLPFSTIEHLIENGTLKSGSFLIIDEPETHLHPQWQVLFGKLLCRLSKELGIRVVVLSHSPYLIRSIEKEVASGGFDREARFYLMTEDDSGKGLSVAKDVSDRTDEIYYQLYRPLEEI